VTRVAPWSLSRRAPVDSAQDYSPSSVIALSGCFSNQHWQKPLRLEVLDAKGQIHRAFARPVAGRRDRREMRRRLVEVFARHSPPAIPIAPLQQLSCPDYSASSVPSNRPRKTFESSASRPKKGTGSGPPASAGPRGPMRPSRGVPPRGGQGQNALKLVHHSDLISLESERRVLFSGSRSDD